MTFLPKDVQSFFYPFPNSTDKTVDDRVFTMKSALFSPFPPFHCLGDVMMKRDPGGIGFIDEVGGSVDGLMSCTESLGFESSDERRVDDVNLNSEMGLLSGCSSENLRWKREHVRREVRNFPPPLSSLDQNGKPTFFLRPVRKDGKLELQEVKIDRPEVLCASRKDGRLRLHFVCNEDEQFDDLDEEEKVLEECEDEIIEDEESGSVEERADGWQIPVNQHGGDEEGCLKWCHEMVSHHQNHRRRRHGQHGGHHHDMHVWSRHCVTIR